jgi:hypothetical protein
MKMKKIIIFALILLGIVFSFSKLAHAQSASIWKLTGGNTLQPVVSTWGLKVPGINSTGSTRCLNITSAGLFGVASADCGSGGGGSGITSLNALTDVTQTFATGTSGTDFAISSSGSTHTFNIPTASATNRGALSSADWTTFNSKQPAGTYVTSVSGTSNRVTSTGGTTPVLDISSSYVGQSSITTLGTISTGVWNGTDVAFANIAQGSARSVLGVTGNATADVASIQGTADQVLRVNTAGTALDFGTIATAGIADDAVTYAKMQDVSATARVLGRVTAGAGDVEEIVIDADITSVSGSDDTIPSAKAVKTYVDAQFKAIFSANYAADVAAAGVSRFLALTSAVLPDSGTENQREFPLPFSGTAKNYYFITSTTQSGTGSLVLTIRKNGADTSIVITIAAGSAAGTFSNTSNTASFTAGDTLAVKVTNNASVNSAAYNGASLAFY